MRVRKQFSNVSSYNLFLGEEDVDSCSCAYIFFNSEIVDAIIAEWLTFDSARTEVCNFFVVSTMLANLFEKFVVGLFETREPSFLMDSRDISYISDSFSRAPFSGSRFSS